MLPEVLYHACLRPELALSLNPRTRLPHLILPFAAPVVDLNGAVPLAVLSDVQRAEMTEREVFCASGKI